MAMIQSGKIPFIIAEMSGNHGGSLDKAKQLIRAAHEAGCDAVKFQLYRPDDMDDPANDEIYRECMVPQEWLEPMFLLAHWVGIPLFASVFAEWPIAMLREWRAPAIKLASPESTRLDEFTYRHLGRAINEAGVTLIASSGRKDMEAVHALNPDVLMYCVAGYPANVTDDDLQYFTTLSKQRTHRGFSDHSNDIKTPLAMIAAGATVIEKHFKLDDNCIDATFSLNPQQMKMLCDIAHA